MFLYNIIFFNIQRKVGLEPTNEVLGDFRFTIETTSFNS